MSGDRMRIMRAVHALTGSWLDDASCERLERQTGSRMELLAHGVIDLNWLRGHPRVFERFQMIAENAVVAPPPDMHDGAGPRSFGLSMSVKEARRVLAQFQEEPTAVHPFDRLRRMAVELRGRHL